MVGLLVLFFRQTRIGKAMRAVAFDQTAARLMGISVGTVFGSAWALSAAIGALAGLLLAPVIGINPEIGRLIVKALIAAVIGGFGSLGGGLFGGLLLGLLETYSGAMFGAAFKEIVPFRYSDPDRSSRAPAGAVGRDSSPRLAAMRLAHAAIAIVAALVLAIPAFGSSYQLYLAELVLINIVAAIGLNLLTGNCGQISLCHAVASWRSVPIRRRC